MIEIKLVPSNSLTRHHCHVCGGCTEKVYILAEGRDENDLVTRVCEFCLQAGAIDARLAQYATRLEAEAAWTRRLIGQLKVPSFAEWQEREKRTDVALFAAYEKIGYDYDAVLTDDAVYRKALERYEQEKLAEAAKLVPFELRKDPIPF
jgi:hypothetical protein